MNYNLIIKKLCLLRKGRGKVLVPANNLLDIAPYLAFSAGISSEEEFFGLPTHRKFQAIVGILPTASHKSIPEFPEFDKNTNLYIFYLKKCLDHLDYNGEMVVLTPSSFLKYTPLLNEELYKRGTITDIIDAGKVGYIIWRFVADDFSRKTLVNGKWKKFTNTNNRFSFLNKEYTVPFTNLFTIKVGAMSGCDEAFINPKGNLKFITAQTPISGELKQVYFNCYNDCLLPFKDRLLRRRVKRFTESNWWTWGRNHHISNEPRVYVPCKTSLDNPFFHHECVNYDGTLLAIFIKNTTAKPTKIASMLNKVDWEELGFKVGGRFMFSQKTLESVLLPKEFEAICT